MEDSEELPDTSDVNIEFEAQRQQDRGGLILAGILRQLKLERDQLNLKVAKQQAIIDWITHKKLP